MSESINIVKQYFEACPRRDFEKIRELYHPDFSYTGGDGQRNEGAEAGIAVVETFTTALPDLKLDVQSMHAVGDNIVVTEFVARGTHQGELMGVAPTGRKVEVPVCNVIEVRDGKVYAEREYYDSAHLMRQLGVSAGTAHA